MEIKSVRFVVVNSKTTRSKWKYMTNVRWSVATKTDSSWSESLDDARLFISKEAARIAFIPNERGITTIRQIEIIDTGTNSTGE